MRVYLTEDIARDVRVAIDQNMQSEALTTLGDVDTLSTDEIIKSKICEAVRRIHSEAPAYLLDGGYNFGDAVYWEKEGSGWVLLPEDFMRFVVFEMSDWARAVFSAISADDEAYNLMRSRFKGVRGTPQKPMCVVSIRPEGRVLEFYSCKDETATVSKAVYLPYPKIDDSGGVEICSRCYDAVVYETAALALTAMGETEKSNTILELAKSVLI